MSVTARLPSPDTFSLDRTPEPYRKPVHKDGIQFIDRNNADSLTGAAYAMADLVGDAHVKTSETHIQPATPSVVLNHQIPPVQL